MFYKVIKRIFDFICALIGIIGTSPLWIVGIIGILVSDWGPVFYTARRIGKNNKPFKMYKFRSMRVAKAATEASLRPDEDRIFPFGHFIRKVKICMRAPGEDMILQIKKYQLLKELGFSYFCSVDSNLGWTQLGNEYFRMDALM